MIYKDLNLNQTLEERLILRKKLDFNILLKLINSTGFEDKSNNSIVIE
jgi:hypothetical protein